MDKKRGGSLFFMAHLYSILNTLSFGLILGHKKRPTLLVQVFYNNLELTYFPGFDPSIISGAGLNFSVRDGKR